VVNISLIQQALEHWFFYYFCMTPTFYFRTTVPYPKYRFCFQWLSNIIKQITMWFFRLGIGTGILWYCLVVKTTERYYISSYHLFWLSTTIPNNTCQQNRFQYSWRSTKFLKRYNFHTSTFERKKKQPKTIFWVGHCRSEIKCWSHTEIEEEPVF
jgi:hypothetical protein